MLLYETLSQPLLCFLFIVIGFGSAFLFTVSHFVFLCLKKNKIAGFFLDFLTVLSVCFIFFFSLLALHYGQIRFFFILSFTAGMVFQQILLKKFLAKISEKSYSYFRNKGKREEDGTKLNG